MDAAAAPDLHSSRLRRAAKLIVVLMASTLSGIVPIAVVPALPALAAHFGGGTEGALRAQMITTLPALAIILGAPGASVLIERLGARITLLMLLFLFTAAGTFGVVSPGFLPLIVSRLLLGLGAGGAAAVSATLIAEWYPGHARDKVFGYTGAFGGVLAFVALIGSGELVKLFGWQAAFWLYLLATPAILLTLWTVGATSGWRQQAQTADGFVRELTGLYLLLVLMATGMFFLPTLAPFLFQSNGITDPAMQGQILGVGSLAAIGSALIYGQIRRLLTGERVLMLAAATLAAGLAGMALAHEIAALFAGTVLTFAGVGLIAPAMSSIILSRASEAARPRAAGLLMGAIFLGQFLTPYVTFPIQRAFGISATFIVAAAVFATLIIVIPVTRVARLPEVLP